MHLILFTLYKINEGGNEVKHTSVYIIFKIYCEINDRDQLISI